MKFFGMVSLVSLTEREPALIFEALLDEAQEWPGGLDLEYWVPPVEDHSEALIDAHYPAAEVEDARERVVACLELLAEDQEADRLRLMVESMAGEAKVRVLTIARNPTVFTQLKDVLTHST